MKKIVWLLAAIFAALFVLVPGGSAVPQTTKHILILLLNYQDTQPYNMTTSQAVTSFQADIAPYFQTQSYDTVGFDSVAYGWYKIQCPITTCTLTDIQTQGLAAAQSHGVDTSAYDHRVFVMSGGVSNSCGGIACGGGDLNSGVVFGGPNVISLGDGRHEFAHSIGVNHTDGLGPTGGNATDRLPAAALNQLGWLPALSVSDGTYSLISVEQATGLRAIQIPRPDGTRLVIEYRSDSGMIIESDNNQYFGYVYRYIASPCNSYMLTAGKSYYDSAGRILLTASANNTVTVTTNTDQPGPLPPDVTPPTTPVLSGSKQGSRVNLSWSSSTDAGCSINYNVYRGGTLIGTTSGNSWIDTPPKKQSNFYKVSATDDSQNTSSFSNSVIIQS